MNLGELKNKFTKSLKEKSYRLGVHPALDWILALGVFFVLTLLGVFLTITNRPGFPATDDTGGTGSTVLSQTLLQRVLSHFETRQREFDALLRNAPNLVDPSL